MLSEGYLLQLGVCGDNVWLSQTGLKKNWICTPCLNTKQVSLRATPKQLPLSHDSVNGLIAPFILEIFSQNSMVFDEIDRILSPMGHVVFLGINPLSLWGLALVFHGLGPLGLAQMKPHSPWVLKRAFLNRGYQQKHFEMFHYVPPFHHQQWIQHSLFLNEMGKIMPVFPAGFYCLVMQKYEKSLIGPIARSSQLPVFSPG